MKKIKISLPEELVKEIDIQAKKANLSRSAYIRNYIEDAQYAYKIDVLELLPQLIAIEKEIEKLDNDVRDAFYKQSNQIWNRIRKEF